MSIQSEARKSLTTFSLQLDHITSQLGKIGASQSRVGYEIDTIQSRRENFLRAESALIDVDVAAESSKLTLAKIRQETGVALLPQANLSPQIALKLLKNVG